MPSTTTMRLMGLLVIVGVAVSLAACSSGPPRSSAEYDYSPEPSPRRLTLFADGSYCDAYGMRGFQGTWWREGDRLFTRLSPGGGQVVEPEVWVREGSRLRLEREGEPIYLYAVRSR